MINTNEPDVIYTFSDKNGHSKILISEHELSAQRELTN
jgi:hypothetical protein